jgi:HK97 gp10 family phage protein
VAKFRLTNPGLATGLTEKAVNIAMLEIWRDARETAPVDTGNLANSIIPDGPFAKGLEAYGYVGTNVTYAPFVEFGTKYMPARPFLGRALEAARRKYG